MSNAVETEGGAEPRPEAPRRVPVTAPASILASFERVKASRGLPSVYDWNDTGSASSVLSDHRMNRSSNGCKSVPDRFCGFVPPFRCATVSAAEVTGA